jgi:hypothetical protein
LVLSVMVPLLKLNDTFKVLRGPTLVQKKKIQDTSKNGVRFTLTQIRINM